MRGEARKYDRRTTTVVLRSFGCWTLVHVTRILFWFKTCLIWPWCAKMGKVWRLSPDGAQRLSCGAQGYPTVHKGYPDRCTTVILRSFGCWTLVHVTRKHFGFKTCLNWPWCVKMVKVWQLSPYGYPSVHKVILQYTKVILIGAQQLSWCSQKLPCGAQGYPVVHNGYPGLTGVGARDTCVTKNLNV